jgi:putative Mn2+ efflux pump MntP
LDIIELIILAAALGIDCFIVSFSQGLIFRTQRKINSLKLALTMGLFQGFMPIIGYVATDKISKFVMPYSKWIVFTLFFILGLHFISDAFSKDKEEQIQCIGIKCLITLGIATSIDALISGVPLKLTSTNLTLSCVLICLASFIMAIGGFWSSSIMKNIPSKYLQITGGLLPIGLALKSFFIP